jgi:hypothetical protein
MTWTTDDVVETTRRTDDDKALEREQKAKRQDKAEASRREIKRRSRLIKLLPARRCARCQHWEYPSDRPAPKHHEVNPYGDCYGLSVLRERSEAIKGGEKGTVISRARLLELQAAGFATQSEPFRTEGFFSCSQLEEVADVLRDPDVDQPIAVVIAEEETAA